MGRQIEDQEIRIGVIGCGGFGLFALQHFLQIPGVALAGMAGTHRPASIAAVKRFGVADIQEVDNLVTQPDIDLIYIASPPFLHFEQAGKVLRAGKHVICEKPLALTLEQAEEMIEEAHKRNLLLIANLMQRYNPLFGQIKEIIDRQILGEFLYGHFENCAADEGLSSDHWFWEREKSGGIFIEHGVHFFDLFEGWFGPGKVEAAQRSLRPGPGCEEQVNCTVRYENGALVNFYHGFHQLGRLDRQEARLVFERGEARLSEWIPTQVFIHCVADETQTRQLCDLFPGARLDVATNYGAKERLCQARHKDVDAMQLIEIHYGEDRSKMRLYGELLRAMMRDQLAWIKDRGHRRVIDEGNGYRSLATAVEATRLAQAAEGST